LKYDEARRKSGSRSSRQTSTSCSNIGMEQRGRESEGRMKSKSTNNEKRNINFYPKCHVFWPSTMFELAEG
jgi:hypothetical protein